MHPAPISRTWICRPTILALPKLHGRPSLTCCKAIPGSKWSVCPRCNLNYHRWAPQLLSPARHSCTCICDSIAKVEVGCGRRRILKLQQPPPCHCQTRQVLSILIIVGGPSWPIATICRPFGFCCGTIPCCVNTSCIVVAELMVDAQCREQSQHHSFVSSVQYSPCCDRWRTALCSYSRLLSIEKKKEDATPRVCCEAYCTELN
jgi:hypothetical protein